MKYKELIEVDIDNLKFDQNNPRLPKKLYGADDSKVIEWMLLDASLLDLIASIADNGFFPGEPLLAIQNKGNKSYTVIEGNRRLASCKILKNPAIATVKSKSILSLIGESNPKNIPSKLPVFVFEKREDILAYLGYRHVTGVKSWGALPKAKYLYELYLLDESVRPLKQKCKDLAQKIGSKGDYVLKLLTSYLLFQILEKNKFFGIKNLSEETIEFSNLVDAATRFGNISKFLNIDFTAEIPLENLNLKHLEKLSTWLFRRDDDGRTMIGENRNIRLLNQVIGNPRALEEFEESGDIKNAYLLTSVPDEIFIQSISLSHKNLKNAEDVLAHISKAAKEESKETLDQSRKVFEKISNAIN